MNAIETLYSIIEDELLAIYLVENSEDELVLVLNDGAREARVRVRIMDLEILKA